MEEGEEEHEVNIQIYFSHFTMYFFVVDKINVMFYSIILSFFL